MSGLPALGACRGSRPSSLPRALELVDSWILGTTPRMTQRSVRRPKWRLAHKPLPDELVDYLCTSWPRSRGALWGRQHNRRLRGPGGRVEPGLAWWGYASRPDPGNGRT